VVPRVGSRQFSSGHLSVDEAIAQLPEGVADLLAVNVQTALPAIARDPLITERIERVAGRLTSEHSIVLGDARKMRGVPDASVHLVVTSPPYWTLKEYEHADGQLGAVADYEAFVRQLGRVWREVYRVLVPGGRLVVVVGDVLLSRRVYGRHVVFPLHASIQESCRKIGFDNLAPIIWYKIGNAAMEVENGSSFLGKPYEPNAVIKNDLEYILFQRKPGGYRSVDTATRVLSVIPAARHAEWFTQIWSLGGASTREHPAPYPLGMIERLVRMFSFVGDTVLDPFTGTGTTNVAAARWGRNSIGWEVIPSYVEHAARRLEKEAAVTRQLRIEGSAAEVAATVK
jgi:DNA modification methylase